MADANETRFFQLAKLNLRGAGEEVGIFIPREKGVGAWDEVNKYLETIMGSGEPPQRFELALMILEIPVDEDGVLEYINKWMRINGWELLVDQEQVRGLAECLESDRGDSLAKQLRFNVNNFRGEQKDNHLKGNPERYLAFISACTALQFKDEPDGSVAKGLFNEVLTKLEDKKFRACMIEICGWKDAARPAAIMKPYLIQPELD